MRKAFIILFCLLSLSVNARIRYLSPRGDNANAGTDTSSTGAWATWQYAATNAVAGDTVYCMGGVWYVTGTSAVATFPNSGTYAERICFFNYPGQSPIIDGRLRFNQDWNTGFNFPSVNFIKLRGIEIRNFLQPRSGAQQAVGLGASDCTNLEFENMNIHNIGGSGIRYFGAWRYPAVWDYPGEGFLAATWYQAAIDHGYAYELHGTITGDTVRFINCDSYNNCDSVSTAVGAGGSGDGFKYDNEIDSYVEFLGCRAWKNSDDGFDISGTGKSVIDNCWSFGNGLLAGGDGSGFKLAYPRAITDTIRYVYNCIAADNRTVGFPLIVEIYYPCQSVFVVNSIFYRNVAPIYDNYGSGDCLTAGNRIYRNNIDYASTGEYPYAFMPSSIRSHNSWDSDPAVTVTNADFVSLDTTQLDNVRVLGKLPAITFGRLSGTSDLIGAGTNVGMSATPDIGIDWAYYDLTYGAGDEEPPVGDTEPVIYTNNANPIKSILATSGGNITSDGGATVTERGVVWGVSANPTTSNNKITVSGTTGSYSAEITGLASNTTYHVRSYATNSVGTAYGADVSFTTTDHSVDSNRTFSGGKIVVIQN